AYGPQNDVTLKMPAFEWVHVQLHQQKGMISLSPPTICNSARIITLRSPLYVRGTFKNPQAGVKAGPLIARGAVAAALATLVTPAAALLALISPSEGEANQCRTILSQMKK
ncbi:hypothetical protein ACI8EN_021660, partial [Escherichia coli]